MKNQSVSIPAEIKNIYFPNGNFDEKLKEFLASAEQHSTLFEKLVYPFSGEYLLNNWATIIEIVPEFIASIVKTSIPNILKLPEQNKHQGVFQIKFSEDNLFESSAIILDAWNTCSYWYDSKYLDQELHQQLYEKLNLLQINDRHSDLLGCLQLIYNEILLRAKFPKKIEFNLLDLFFPLEKDKRNILLKLTGEFTKVVNLLDTQPADSIFLSDKNKLLSDIERSIYKGVLVSIVNQNIICNATTFHSKIDVIKKLKNKDINILFYGEAGTGKEYFARYLTGPGKVFITFYSEANFDKSFENLMLAFEEEKSIHQPGIISQAHGGTIFFREMKLPIAASCGVS